MDAEVCDTEHRQQPSDDCLRRPDELLRIALKNSPIMVLHQDLSHRYRWVYNTRFPAELMVGKTDEDLLPHDQAEQLRVIKCRVLETGEGTRQEVGMLIDGQFRTYDLTIEPLRERSGLLHGLTITAIDVTEQARQVQKQRRLFELSMAVNRAEALPQIYESALQAILESLNAHRASILLYDSDRVLRFKAWHGLSDSYRLAVEGHSPWAPTDPDPQPISIDDVENAPLDSHLREIVAREGIRSLVFVPLVSNRRLLGKFMVYYDSVHTFTQEDMRTAQTVAGQVAFAIARKQLDEILWSHAKHLEDLVQERTGKLQETIQELERFSYSISHDMRAPLRAMQGFARLLLEDHSDQLGDEAKDYLNRILSASLRQDKLIRDVLSYSRLVRVNPRPESVDLDSLVRGIIREYPNLQSSGADIQIESPLPVVLGNEALLTQCVSNLLGNAIKFISRDRAPRVVVRAEEMTGGTARVWFEDNGIGIASEHQRRIFDIFERIHPEAQYEGSGIGLSIVRKAIERLGGRVGVESSPGQGSRFWVELPRSND